MPAIPRTALAPLGQVVRTGLGKRAAQIEANAGGCEGDATAARRALSELWTAGADLLPRSAMPHEWEAVTGLSADDHAAIARMTAGALSQGEPVQQLVDQAASGGEIAVAGIRPILAAAAVQGVEAMALLLALLLARLPQPEPILLAATRISEGATGAEVYFAVDRAIESTIDRLRSKIEATARSRRQPQIRVSARPRRKGPQPRNPTSGRLPRWPAATGFAPRAGGANRRTAPRARCALPRCVQPLSRRAITCAAAK
jgi:hypothetical protein